MRWPWSRPTATRSTTSGLSLADILLAQDAAGEEPSAGSVQANAFRDNPTVAGGVGKIATAAMSVPWVVQEVTRGDQDKEVGRDHPVRMMLEAPNDWMDWPAVVEHAISSFILKGRCFLLLQGTDELAFPPSRTSPPQFIIPIPRELMRAEKHTDRLGIAFYELDLGRRRVPVHPQRVVDTWTYDPRELLDGQSLIRSAVRSISAQNDARRWNNTLLRKLARPPGFLVTEQDLDDDQIQRLEDQLAKKYQGPDNTGRPGILFGGLDWKTTGWSPADMEWIQGMREAKREIAGAMHIAPELLGDPETKTYANAQEARLALYEDVAFPLLGRLAFALRQKLRFWWPNIDFVLDTDQVPAVQERRRALWDAMAQLVSRYVLTPNEAREAMGYEAIEGADDLLVPIGLVPLTDLAEATEPAEKVPDDDPDVDPGDDEEPEEEDDPEGEEEPEDEEDEERSIIPRELVIKALQARRPLNGHKR